MGSYAILVFQDRGGTYVTDALIWEEWYNYMDVALMVESKLNTAATKVYLASCLQHRTSMHNSGRKSAGVQKSYTFYEKRE